MRRSLVLVSLAALVLSLSVPAVQAETSRTLKVEIPAGAERFAVENLSGTMRIAAGSGDAVVAVATIHAETEELANAVRFEKVEGATGVATFRVRYPYELSTSFRYPDMNRGEHSKGSTHESVHGWLGSLLGLGSNTTTKYDGQHVKISDASGVLVYADVEIRVPRRAQDGAFRNLVGRIEAAEVSGTKLLFDTASGSITLDKIEGDVRADAGSGDVKASRLRGSFTCDTGSGDCDLDGFDGDAVRCDVGSGDVRLSSVTAHQVRTDAGSGDVRAMDIDAEEIVTDSGSGDVELSARGGRLVRVKSEAGSGDLKLRLGADASFEAYADQGSGEIVNRYGDAQPIVKDKQVIGYRRGSAKTRIEFDSGSGDLVLEPGS